MVDIVISYMNASKCSRFLVETNNSLFCMQENEMVVCEWPQYYLGESEQNEE